MEYFHSSQSAVVVFYKTKTNKQMTTYEEEAFLVLALEPLQSQTKQKEGRTLGENIKR